MCRLTETKSEDGIKHFLFEHQTLTDLTQLPSYNGGYLDGWDLGPFVDSRESFDNAVNKGLVPADIFAEFKRVRALLEPAIEQFSGNAKTTRRRRKNAEVGLELDIARYIGKDPDCWITRPRGRKKRLVRIAVMINNNGNTGTEVYTRTGALAGAAAELLHRVGLAVEVVALSSSHDSRDKTELCHAITLKHANERVDHSKILLSALQGLTRVLGYTGNAALGHPPSQTQARKPSATIREALKINAIINHEQNIEKSGKGSVFHDADLEGFFTRASEILSGVTTKKNG